MARSNDIQYVRYYTFGSAARELELPRKKKPQPKAQKEPAALPVIKLDGLSAVGLAMAAVMLVCMIVGAIRVSSINDELQDWKRYVSQLEIQNDELRYQYESGYNIDEIRIAAESMGMVPVEEVRHITVSVPENTQAELSWWQALLEGIQDFFA